MCGSYPYRVKTIGGIIKHVSQLLSIISSGFRQHVPKEDGGEFGRLIPNGLSVKAIRDAIKASRKLQGAGQATYAGVPRREVLAMLAGLVRSQGPNHDLKYEKLPELAGRWFKKYDENPKIAARWYTVGAGVN